jgi:hypothetical protein
MDRVSRADGDVRPACGGRRGTARRDVVLHVFPNDWITIDIDEGNS